MSDTAEYWADVKRPRPIVPDYYHIPNYDCGHKHYYEAEFIDDVNCGACKKALKEGIEHNLKSVEEHKKHNANLELQRINNCKHKWKQKYPDNPICTCGFPMLERTNKTKGTKFYGCSQFPICKNTSPLKTQ